MPPMPKFKKNNTVTNLLSNQNFHNKIGKNCSGKVAISPFEPEMVAFIPKSF